MKILYLNGPYKKLAFSRPSRSPAVTKSGTIYYPIWLAYAAGLAQQETDYHIHLIDAVARKWDHPELLNHLQNNPADLVFCDSSTPSIEQDLATASAIKKILPQSKIVMVGTHATATAKDLLQTNHHIDAVAQGEYDRTAIELAHALDNKQSWQNITGITFRQNHEIIQTPPRDLIDNLDIFPFISKIYRDFLDPQDYFFSAAQFPMVMIITSRGCPHRCGWCLYPQVMHRGKYRLRSAQNVAAEFEFIAREMPRIREVGIEDDLFTGNKNRLREICQLLIRQNNKLNFWCDTRVDLDYQTMALMKRAGCRLLIAGFESADQEILNNINKGTNPQSAFQFVADARRAGLLVHGCFVLGNPGETHQSMRRTLDFAKKLNPDTAQFFPMIVYPGTAMYQWAQENQYLTTQDYRNWLTEDGLHNSVVDLPGLPSQEVLRFCNQARREFYLRKGYLFKKLTQSLTNFHEAKRNVKAFSRFAKFLVKAS